MFSIVPLNLSIFFFYVANSTGIIMALIAGVFFLLIGIVMAYLELSAWWEYRKLKASRYIEEEF